MKVIIFGVGRSGTTALYSFLQKLMEQQLGADTVDFIYEPFLWDRTVFNKQYDKITDEFSSINSFSVDGMYHHQKIPIFCDEQSHINKYSSDFIKELVTPKDKEHLLLKSIRMSGRKALFDIFEDIKFIFLLRSPLDVLNSSLPIFSFYGNNYHKSDETRFFSQVNQIYAKNYNINTLSHVEKQAKYWKYSNINAFDQISKSPRNTLILSHEEYIHNPSQLVKKVCDHLDLKYFPSLEDMIKKKTGPLTKNINLCETDFQTLYPYHKHYKKLLVEQNLYSESDTAISNKFNQFPKYSNILDFNNVNANELTSRITSSNKIINQLQQALVSEKARSEMVSTENALIISSWEYKFGKKILNKYVKAVLRLPYSMVTLIYGIFKR